MLDPLEFEVQAGPLKNSRQSEPPLSSPSPPLKASSEVPSTAVISEELEWCSSLLALDLALRVDGWITLHMQFAHLFTEMTFNIVFD